MASFTSLPFELVAHIGEFTDPYSHLDLACTCSFIADSLKDILKRHRIEYAKKPCSDFHPLTVPRTLRNVIADPVAAYHLQTINIWCARSKWSQWKPFQLQAPPGSDEDYFKPGETPIAWSFRPDEVEVYLDLLGNHLTGFEGEGDLRETARDELARGDDGVLKALLIILCPRLKTVYYARTSYVRIEDEQDVGNTSLAWLCRIIMSYRGQDMGVWPPGLKSLRHLGVGVETGSPFDSEIWHVYHPMLLAKIMNLPNLESIYLYGQGYREHHEDHDNEEASSLLTPDCSSVRHIYLENLEELDTEFWDNVVIACKSQLTSVALHGGESHDVDAYISSVIENALNLQSVMCYGSELSGYRCTLFYPRDILGGYTCKTDLRIATVAIDDIALESDPEGSDCRQGLINYFIGAEDDPYLPEALEVLVLPGSFNNCFPNYVDGRTISRVEESADWFDEALAAMISSTEADKRRNETRSRRQENDGEEEEEEDEDDNDDDDNPYIYPNLKAIYVEPWGGRETATALQSPSRLWLQKSIQAGIERGVDVRTRTNVNPPLHRGLRFHMAPTRFDLRPDIAPPENHEFDPLQGKWVDRRCWNCGHCDDCFALFPEKLWAQACRAPEAPIEEENENEEELRNESDERGDETCEEIWTKISREIEPRSFRIGYHIQQLDEYTRDRQCAGEDAMSYLDREMPPIGFPETARQKDYSLRAE